MLLAVDTSTRAMGIAIFDGHNVLSQESWQTSQHHTVELAQAVKNNINRIGVSVDDLTGLGVALGPGSFTGLRIGMAFMKGIAFHQQLPLVGIPTLDITAESQPVREAELAAVLKAGRDRYAVGWYRAEDGRWISRGRVDNFSLEELLEKIEGPIQIAGELSPETHRELSDNPHVSLASPVESYRSPAVLAQLAWSKWKKGDDGNPAAISPIYLNRDQPLTL